MAATRHEAGSGSDVPRRNTAAWLIPSLVYMMLVGLLGVTTKLALDDLEWPELVLWTSISYAVIALALVWAGGQRLQLVPDARWGALSGGFAATALIMLFLALNSGDVSRVVPITASYPAVTLLLAAVVLGERVTGKRIVATSLVIAGVILLSVE
jgi:transporter family protein